jgi:alpha-1,2-mannosyltransferase
MRRPRVYGDAVRSRFPAPWSLAAGWPVFRRDPQLSTPSPATSARWRSAALLAAGLIVFAGVLASYLVFIFTHPTYRWLSPVDLHVYRDAGLVVAQHSPPYDARLAAPLYDRRFYENLNFTYSPFAALAFLLLTLPKWTLLLNASIGVDIAALVATVWATLGGLGYRVSAGRLGGALLLSGALLWTEPVQRTLYIGQIELVLMALIMWDMCQSDSRWWKGAGVGVAAGIKLVPLVFIPYLLLTRRYRQSAVAAGTFAATVLLGFALLPGDSSAWWFGGLFTQGGRTGFTGWEGNQSLAALITRRVGSISAGKPIWFLVAGLTLIGGWLIAAALDRAGHRVVGVLTCALTGLLVSPISWDHHWVWIVPGVAALAVYGLRARGVLRAAYLAGAVLLGALFGAWPVSLWGESLNLAGYTMGLIWAPPDTNPSTYDRLGDRPWYAEYHWHGLQLISGNLYVLTGIVLFALLAVIAVRVTRGGRRGADSASAAPTGAAVTP